MQDKGNKGRAWKRYLARAVDGEIYQFVWIAVLSLFLNVNCTNRGIIGNLLDIAVSIVAVLLVEPVLLSVFGTTIGKWLLGFSVVGSDGQKLSYKDAVERTFLVVERGMGFGIPLYNIYRYWDSYRKCSEGETLDWERKWTLVQRDSRAWCVVSGIGAFAVVFAASILIILAPYRIPKNRGDITVAEFCENYNRFLDYYGYDEGYRLNSKGEWVGDTEEDSYTISLFDERTSAPELHFTEKDGVMAGMSFSIEATSDDAWMPSYRKQMYLYVLAFVCARKDCGFFSDEKREILEMVSDSFAESYRFSEFGVDVNCQIEYSGYMESESLDILVPEDDVNACYSFSFEMTRVN